VPQTDHDYDHGLWLTAQGVSYVAWPRLNPPIAILAYNGPGAKSMKRGRGLSWWGMVPFSGRKARYVVPQGRSKTGDELEMGRRKGALID
jgi:hypothetical protein